MQIGIIGSGHIGGTLARKLVGAGHTVGIANAGGPATLRDFVGELGGRSCPMSVEEAASFGKLVIVSIPFGAYGHVPPQSLGGKIVIDTMNYYAQRDGAYPPLDSGRVTSSELLQTHLSETRLVKAFNTVPWQALRDGARPAGAPDRIAVPVAGDDAEAKRVVMKLVDEIGFDAVDAGSLAEGGRHLQPGSPVYATLLNATAVRKRLAA